VDPRGDSRIPALEVSNAHRGAAAESTANPVTVSSDVDIHHPAAQPDASIPRVLEAAALRWPPTPSHLEPHVF